MKQLYHISHSLCPSFCIIDLRIDCQKDNYAKKCGLLIHNAKRFFIGAVAKPTVMCISLYLANLVSGMVIVVVVLVL